MGKAELLIGGLLVAIAGLGALARRFSIPYPIVLVIGGALFGFIPGLPAVKLDPNVVLVVFLPVLVYSAAFFANLADIRQNLRGVTLVSVGLVLVTMTTVAIVAHALAGLPWAAAFALGAVISPTDPLAAGLIMRSLNVPRLLVSSAEGEGLFNDATALVAFRVAVTAVVAGSFSLGHATILLIVDAAAGVAIGLAVGWLIAEIRKRTPDPQINITISLVSGYAAFVPASAVGASGVLAAVTCGIYMGIRGPSIIPARTRLQANLVWDIVDFIINSALFVLVGLQLRTITESLSGYSTATLLGWGLAIAGVTVVTRMVWFFSVPYLVRALDRRPSQRERRIPARNRFLLGWIGMRGAVSLAAALSLPLTINSGAPFPDRDLIQFLTFAVIFVTLVVQGLSLPTLIRRLRITDDGAAETEELKARLAATKAALAQIEELSREDWTRDDTIERMRAAYDYRKRRLAARAGKIEDDGYEDRSMQYQQAVQIVLGAQRDALVELRREGTISNETMNRIIRELDLEESRLEI
ncbi:MAG TPA: Na+/H+ antiporter [Solirubrobacteraceae bacterium]|nr:Na+/H+ antiporter [Solirubrobacteraceae bacterium]